MNASVGTKTQKKQSSLLPPVIPESGRRVEQALLSLENACLYILDIGFVTDRRDTEARYWQQRFKNIATPVSLALAECKGPRSFHYHYRHREDDESVLHPVQPPPLDMLAQVCKESLRQCRSELVGIQDEAVLDARNMLESALTGFLVRYRDYSKEAV